MAKSQDQMAFLEKWAKGRVIEEAEQRKASLSCHICHGPNDRCIYHGGTRG